MKIVDESIFFFSRVSLSQFFLECEKSIFPKQGGLATWPRDWAESRVQAAS